MSVRERTSIELPRALSGSKVLMTWPGVASTRTVWANTGVAWAVINTNAIRATVRVAFLSSFIEHLAVDHKKPSEKAHEIFEPTALAPPSRGTQVLFAVHADQLEEVRQRQRPDEQSQQSEVRHPHERPDERDQRVDVAPAL